METFKVGMIGCGSISGNHFHAIRHTENAQVAAVCDIRPDRLEKAMQEQAVPGYADYHELLSRSDIDAVHVCVPHYLHGQISVDALRAGKHVLCEKPMGMSLMEAEAMERAQRESGKQLTICFQNRYNGASQRMKKIIDGGSLGRVIGGSAFMCWDRDEAYYQNCYWRGSWEKEGGSVLINQAIHTLDLLRWLSGGLTLKNATMTAKRLADTIETEDTCDMLLENERGNRFIFFCTNCASGNQNILLNLILEKGEMHMDGARLTVVSPDGVTCEDFSAGPGVGKDYWGAGHDLLISSFYAALAAGKAPYITAQDALETTRIMDAAYHSASILRKRP